MKTKYYYVSIILNVFLLIILIIFLYYYTTNQSVININSAKNIQIDKEISIVKTSSVDKTINLSKSLLQLSLSNSSIERYNIDNDLLLRKRVLDVIPISYQEYHELNCTNNFLIVPINSKIINQYCNYEIYYVMLFNMMNRNYFIYINKINNRDFRIISDVYLPPDITSTGNAESTIPDLLQKTDSENVDEKDSENENH